tara:strand:- start:46 stop:1272 length:1227 start_codon:yes stop_codon:yes gene_type:complete
MKWTVTLDMLALNDSITLKDRADILKVDENIVSMRIDKLRGNGNFKWNEHNSRLIGKRTDKAIAEMLGVKPTAVRYRRKKENIKPHRSNVWDDESVKLIGSMSDSDLAWKLNISYRTVHQKRLSLNIPRFDGWTKKEIKLLGTMKDNKLAEKIGRSYHSITKKRVSLKIPMYIKSIDTKHIEYLYKMNNDTFAQKFGYSKTLIMKTRKLQNIPKFSKWDWRDTSLLGTDTDRNIAKIYGICLTDVTSKRNELNIKPFNEHFKRKKFTKEEIKLLGTLPDDMLAYQLDTTVTTITKIRTKMNIPRCKKTRVYPNNFAESINWTPKMIAYLGTVSDLVSSIVLGISFTSITEKREEMNIPPYRHSTKRITWDTNAMTYINNMKLSAYKVSNILNVSHMTVYNKRKRMGLY